jgi:FlaG/FlaF family flagellin (archaellin)
VNYNAVSPVIGVMLMLVVVIIIAAVVSAFAGGIVTSEDKTPQAKISASFSQSKGLTFCHEGGDNIPINEVRVILRPLTMKKSAQYSSYEVNKTVIENSDHSKTWSRYYGYNDVVAFRPGDCALVSYENRNWTQTRPDGTVDYYYWFSGIGYPENVGYEFDLNFILNEKVVATTRVPINP